MTAMNTKKGAGRSASRKYGVICRQSEAHVMRKMGVADRDITGIDGMNGLLAHMDAGDILCVPTIVSFAAGAYDLFCKMQFLSNRGIEFQSGSERYLNFSPVHPLPTATVETLKNFALREAEFVKWVQCTIRQKCRWQTGFRQNLLQISLSFLRITVSGAGGTDTALHVPHKHPYRPHTRLSCRMGGTGAFFTISCHASRDSVCCVPAHIRAHMRLQRCGNGVCPKGRNSRRCFPCH